MDKKTLLKILKTESISFTHDEIIEFMNEELDKTPDEMDTELVDLCLAALEKCNSTPEQIQKAKHKKIKFKKVLLIAAVIAGLFCISIPVSAKYLHIEVSEQIVQFYRNYFNVDLQRGKKEALDHSDINMDIVRELKKKGVKEVILPQALFENSYDKSIMEVTNDEGGITASIKIKDKRSDLSGTITINQYTEEYAFAIGQSKVSDQFDSVQQLSINGMDIVVFGNSEESFIDYVDQLTEYHIVISNCDFEKALEIAKTIN